LHTLLTRSGYKLSALRGEDLQAAAEQMVVDVVTGVLNLDQLQEWLKARIRKR
jgi:hypothetical protein